MLTLALLLCCAAPVPTGPELLPNPSFEQGGALPDGWTGFMTRDWGDCAGEIARTDETAAAGRWSAEVRGVRVRYALVTDRLEVQPGQDYLFSAMVRTDLGRGENAYLAASWSSDQRWLALTSSARRFGSGDWSRLELILPAATRPEGATRLQVSFRVESDSGAGRAWVDDVSLRPVALPAPPSKLEQERRRQIDLTRRLLVERAMLRDRRDGLRREREELERLLADPSSTPAELPAAEPASRRLDLLAATPTDRDALLPRLAELDELPRLREECLGLLGEILNLKRRLDATPEARRAWLRAQVSAPPAPRVALPVALTAEVAAPLAEPSQDLLDIRCRSRLQPAGGSLELTGRARRAAAGDHVVIALLDRAGAAMAVSRAEVADGRFAAAVDELPVRAWYPDYSYLYDLHLVLVRDGRAVDRATRRLAFRSIEIRESDVSGTLRQARQWAPVDRTMVINGQPWFLRGTVANDLRRGQQEPVLDLFEELWLEFHRTYGNTLGTLAGDLGESLADRGMGLLGSISPDYNAISQYVSADQGLEEFRALADGLAPLVEHPGLFTLQIGNEEELAVWGADLPSVFGNDLWMGFDAVAQIVREEMAPPVPVSYVRAAHFDSVAPVPLEDYSGVNQYTGRYWGTRRTIAGDLSNLSWTSAAEGKPYAVTEWNGPKYSWATRGVSGVDEAGAASYIYDYWREMTAASQVVLSTEFVLNWVVTPVEDLTSVPLAEGLANRARWKWNDQQGTPWYPDIFPDLLTDTPGRRAMQGFQSPWYDLVENAGAIRVFATPEHRADGDRAVAALAAMGREAELLGAPGDLGNVDANLLLLGGEGANQPDWIKAYEATGLLGITDATFPATGDYLVQRRVRPEFPDRVLVAVTAADAEGWRAAMAHLDDSAAGLTEAMARRASQRRLLALIDDNDAVRRAFETYVVELPTRGWFVARDDFRTQLDPAELLSPAFADLGLIVVATKRALTPAEIEALSAAAGRGVAVIWSLPALEANPAVGESLGVTLGEAGSLVDSIPVAEWARDPVLVPQLGDVAKDRLMQFGGYQEDDPALAQSLRTRRLTLAGDWQVAASDAGGPIVARRGANWVFGADLSAAAVTLVRVTGRGVNHSIYDRDTANGLERLFRLMTNAGVLTSRGGTGLDRPASRPRLNAVIEAPYRVAPGEPLTVDVIVRNAAGRPAEGVVRATLAPMTGNRYGNSPDDFRPLTRVAAGRYRWTVPADEVPAPPPASFRERPRLGVFASVEQPGWVGDWTSATVGYGAHSDEPVELAGLVERVRDDLVPLRWSVDSRETWIELRAELLVPYRVAAGRPAELSFVVDKLESDTGNDWMEEIELILTPEDGAPVRLPILPGKILSTNDAPINRERPNDVLVVNSTQPARVTVVWPDPTVGQWQVALKFRYTDQFHIEDTNRLLQEIPLPGANLIVEK